MRLIRSRGNASADARQGTLSDLLAGIAADETCERVSLGDLLERAGDRAFGVLIFLFALPNIVPTPPGTSAVLGLPLILLSAQFMWGRQTPWLPRIVAARSIERTTFVKMATRMVPVLRRFERVLKPRLGSLVSPLAERFIGTVLLVLAIILFLPVPFGNILPAAAICILSLAIIEHDGLVSLVGLFAAVFSVVFIWGAFIAVLRTGLAVVEHLGWI